MWQRWGIRRQLVQPGPQKVPKQPLGDCSPLWQRPLLPGSSLLLNLSPGCRQEVPILARHCATAERALAGRMVLCRWCWARHAAAGPAEALGVTLLQDEGSCFQQVEGPQPLAPALQGNGAPGLRGESQPGLGIIKAELPNSWAHGVGLP